MNRMKLLSYFVFSLTLIYSCNQKEDVVVLKRQKLSDTQKEPKPKPTGLARRLFSPDEKHHSADFQAHLKIQYSPAQAAKRMATESSAIPPTMLHRN